MNEVRGACHCGAVSYQCQSGPLAVVNYHCSLCRRRSGAAFSTYAVVGQDQLADENKAAPSAFRMTDKGTRQFCSSWGTPEYNVNTTACPEVALIYHSTL